MRIVVELKKDADADGVLAYLLKKTDLQVTYNFNMVAIVNRTPKQLGIKEMLQAYIAHQKEVVTHRTQYDLEKAEDRSHVLEGLVKALNRLDEVIETIKGSDNRPQAQKNLMEKFRFTERQADAILTLQLYRLTNLEITSLEKELLEVNKLIASLRAILDSEKKLMSVIKKELLEVHKKYGEDRRSEIQHEVEELKVNLEVMVNAEDVMVTLSQEGYIKRTSMMSYTRSGGEIESAGLKEGDYLRHLMEINTLDKLLLFTAAGQSYVLPVHQIPEYKWKENGTAIVNVIPIPKEDRIVSVIPIRDFNDEKQTIVFVTKKGQVKRSLLKDYETNRTSGIVACKLSAGDEVIQVQLSDNEQDILLVTRMGMSIRFKENVVNTMGRATSGVRGIQLKEDDAVVGALWVNGDEGEVIVISDRGYAKRTLLMDYVLQARGGKGLQTFEFKEGKRVKSNGKQLIASFYVRDAYDLMAVTESSGVHYFSTEALPIEDRKSIGKAVIKLEKTDSIIDVVKPV